MRSAQRIPGLAGPQNLDAERQLIGGLMVDASAVERIADWLAPDDFTDPMHRALYSAVLALSDKNQSTDPVTVSEWIQNQGGDLAAAVAILALEIAADLYSSASVVSHAEIVRERSQRRKLLAIGSALSAAAENPSGDAVDMIIARATLALGDMVTVTSGGLVPYRARVKRVFEALMLRHTTGAKLGLPTPWPEVNEAVGAMRDGELIVLGARSNMGKSVTGFQMARFTAMSRKRVAVFSLEMDEEAIVYRDHAAVGEVPMKFYTQEVETVLQWGDYNLHWDKTTAAMKVLRDIDMVVDTDPQLSSSQITARAKRAHRQKPLDLIVIDHLHEVALPGVGREDQELGQAISDFAALAKHCDCPVLLLAQLNRKAASDKSRPSMVHLRGAGKIEERADLVLFLHRPDYYDSNDRPGLVEMIVGKGRNVQTGLVINLRNRFDIMRADPWEGAAPIHKEAIEPPPKVRPKRGFDDGDDR